MTHHPDKAMLLKEFEAYLDSYEELRHDQNSEQNFKQKMDLPEQQSDLYSLFVEMSALKSEVKTQARQFKSALDDFRTVFSTLSETQTRLQNQLEKKEQQLESVKMTVSRTFLLDLIELRDRVNLSILSIESYSSKGMAKWFGDADTLRQTVLKGQKILLKRINQQLKNHQVRLIKTENQKLNPHWMKVVATVQLSDYENGRVVEEITPGFIYNGQLLRLAEVKVNKLTHSSTKASIPS